MKSLGFRKLAGGVLPENSSGMIVARAKSVTIGSNLSFFRFSSYRGLWPQPKLRGNS